MNDTLREYLSYGKLIIPMLKVRREITPEKVQWGEKDQFFSLFGTGSDTLVIYINGGGWRSNSPDNHFFIGQAIAKAGNDCAMLCYRKVPAYSYEEIADDIFKGYMHLQDHLKASGRAYDKVTVMGASAGAHLAAVLCFDERKKREYGISDTEIDRLVLMAAPLCFDPPMTGAIRSLLTALFASKDRAHWKKGEPYSLMYSIPCLDIHIIQSRHDGLVGYEQAEMFAEKAESLGMSAQLHEVTDSWDTHSAYCVGSFLLDRERSSTLDRTLNIISKNR